MPLIIKFIHPGGEYIPKKRSDPNVVFNPGTGDSGLRLWNNLDKHKRKFMRISADYCGAIGAPVKRSQISFWGEWEAESCFTLMQPAGSPRYLHVPHLNAAFAGGKRHNTDPFVFGKRFWYTDCHQKRYPILRALPPFSLILFGTQYPSPDGFRLDTVFVTKVSSTTPIPNNRISTLPQQLLDTNLNHNNLNSNGQNQFYEALMRHDGEELFSFVPCKPILDNCVVPHERPLIDLALLGLSNGLRQGIQTAKVNHSQMLVCWKKVRDDCLNQGFALGVQLGLPDVVGYPSGVTNPC